MDSSLQGKYLPILQKHWLPILLGVAGMMFLGYGLITLSFGSAQDKAEIVFEQGSESSLNKSGEQKKTITVDIEGAVVRPGVYDLPNDARVQDALIATGGMSDKADREKVSKGLNLAAKIPDGGKIYIPFIGDSSTSSEFSSAGQAGFGVLGADASSALININSASASELDKLQGVGPVTAEKIISNRPYGAIEELVSKKIVGQKVFEQIKNEISVY